MLCVCVCVCARAHMCTCIDVSACVRVCVCVSESRVRGQVECGFSRFPSLIVLDRLGRPGRRSAGLLGRATALTRRNLARRHGNMRGAGGRGRLPPPKCGFRARLPYSASAQRGNHFRARRCHFGSERVSCFEEIHVPVAPGTKLGCH